MNKESCHDILKSDGDELDGKTVVLGISGSVAALRAPDIARQLIRHGALVHPVMTKAACGLIHPHLMKWATGQTPIVELSGAIEHVALVGNASSADLLLIAPATANTIGKIACGIDDTAITTFATTAIGQGIPVLIVPAMHQPMYDNPFVQENLAKLKASGIHFLMPYLKEGKAKIACKKDIVNKVVEILCHKQPWKGKKVFITAGRTVEHLDPIRVLTNNSSGRMGSALAQAALHWGAEVTVIAGKMAVELPARCQVISVSNTQEMFNACQSLVEQHQPEIFLAAAAVSDWRPVQKASFKVPTSQKSFVLELEPTPKIVDKVKSWSPKTFLVAFRAPYNLNMQEFQNDAIARLVQAQADLIVVNDAAFPEAGFETKTNKMDIFDKNGLVEKIPLQNKEKIAQKLLAIIEKKL